MSHLTHQTSAPCPSCHHPTHQSFRFCPSCGTTLKAQKSHISTSSQSLIVEEPKIYDNEASVYRMASPDRQRLLRPGFESGTRMQHGTRRYGSSYTPKESISKIESLKKQRLVDLGEKYARELYGGGGSVNRGDRTHGSAEDETSESSGSAPPSPRDVSTISNVQMQDTRRIKTRDDDDLEKDWYHHPSNPHPQSPPMQKATHYTSSTIRRSIDPPEAFDYNAMKRNFGAMSLSTEEKSRKRARSAVVRRRSTLDSSGNADEGESPQHGSKRSAYPIGSRCELFAHPFKPRGTIRYYGKLGGKRGVWVGVELDEPEGRHDGSLNGWRYFACQPLFGVFMRPNQIRVGNYPPSDIRADAVSFPRGLILRDSMGSHSGSTSIRLKDQTGGGYLPSQLIKAAKGTGFVPNPYFAKKGKKKKSTGKGGKKSSSAKPKYTETRQRPRLLSPPSSDDEHPSPIVSRTKKSYLLHTTHHPTVFDKMMDVRLFTGIHRYRFDEEGRGMGKSGRDAQLKGRGTETTW